MSDLLHVRLWINNKLEVDKDLTIDNAETSAVEHAMFTLRRLAEGKQYLLEISDPDLNDRVIFRFGSDPAQMENPIPIDFRPKRPWEN